MGELTPEAKAAIADAIAIVRSDKHTKFLTDWRKDWDATRTPGGEPPKPPAESPPVPPIPEVTPPPPTGDPSPEGNPPPEDKRKSAYWGVFEE